MGVLSVHCMSQNVPRSLSNSKFSEILRARWLSNYIIFAISQAYIFRILQYFATKLCKFANFDMILRCSDLDIKVPFFVSDPPPPHFGGASAASAVALSLL